MNRKGPACAERETNVMAYHKRQSVSDWAGRGRNSGVALVWSALMLLVMIGLVGLSIDWGKLAVNVHQMQNAADAAALAGGQVVKDQPAEVTRRWAHDMGLANAAEGLAVTLRMDTQHEPFVSDIDLDIILGRWINHQRWFFPTLDTPDAVRVIARRADGLADAPALAMIFGPVFGVDTVSARREAIAWASHAGGAGLIVLDPNAGPGLLIDGTGNIRVIGGTIHVNSTARGTKDNPLNPAAVYVNSASGRMLCGRLTVTGRPDPRPGETLWETLWTDDSGVPWPYDIGEDAPYIRDPLWDLVPPERPTNVVDEKITNGTIFPGYYRRGIEVKTGNTVTMMPGTYWIGGGMNETFQQREGLLADGGFLEARGVLIYLTKDDRPGGQWAKLNIGGNAVTNITPPGDELPTPIKDGLPGISIWQDRDNPSMARIGGGGGMMISGTLYFPNNHVRLAGNPDKAGNQILCGSMEVFGRAEVQVIYDGRNNMSRRRCILVR